MPSPLRQYNYFVIYCHNTRQSKVKHELLLYHWCLVITLQVIQYVHPSSSSSVSIFCRRAMFSVSGNRIIYQFVDLYRQHPNQAGQRLMLTRNSAGDIRKVFCERSRNWMQFHATYYVLYRRSKIITIAIPVHFCMLFSKSWDDNLYNDIYLKKKKHIFDSILK